MNKDLAETKVPMAVSLADDFHHFIVRGSNLYPNMPCISNWMIVPIMILLHCFNDRDSYLLLNELFIVPCGAQFSQVSKFDLISMNIRLLAMKLFMRREHLPCNDGT